MLRKRFNVYLDEVREAVSVAQLGRAFFALASSFGYQRVIVLDPEQFARSMRKALVFTVQGKSGLAEFGDANGYAHHPAIAASLVCDTPYLAEEIRVRDGIAEADWEATFPPDVRGSIRLKLPVHRDARCVLIAACSGFEADASPLARATLHAAAHVFYDGWTELAAGAPQAAAMTNREAEILHWTRNGKTGAEIAKITGISTRTVRYHLHNVKTKLGVNSAMEAIVKLSGNVRRPD
jgi:DNA-binding CsgD family transcriptional regulator